MSPSLISITLEVWASTYEFWGKADKIQSAFLLKGLESLDYVSDILSLLFIDLMIPCEVGIQTMQTRLHRPLVLNQGILLPFPHFT